MDVWPLGYWGSPPKARPSSAPRRRRPSPRLPPAGACQPCTFTCTVTLVKRRELESRLRDLGWTFLRHGGSHDVWTDGERLEYLPRHAEINELLARKILKKAGATKKETDS